MTAVYDFSGKTVLITGASSGIGRATAQRFAESGAAVVIAARRRQQGEQVARDIAALGGRASFVACDVCDETQVEATVERVVAEHGGLDIAFNNAGMGGDMAALADATCETFDAVMATNARAVFVGMKYQVPAMLRRGGGAIVNMSSVYGSAGKAAHHAYVASKHAVIGLTRSVALELADRGVRVNAICAGATQTNAMVAARENFPALVADLVARHPIGRMASEDEIANAVLWLASDHAAYVTGHPLAVDGGYLAA